MAGSPLRVSWELHTPASVPETWALMSDTERFNRAVGFGFRFEEQPQAGGVTRRFGSARFLGLNLRWEELPFQYREFQWYKWERIFLDGPAERLTGTLRLKPRDGGTDILYVIEATPRYSVLSPAVAFELYLRSKPKIERALHDEIAKLAGETIVLEPLPDPLSTEASAALEQMAGRMVDQEVARSLVRFIEEAPLSEQDNISPLRLARQWSQAPDRVVRACLEAVRVGALTLGWDLICPLCQGPKQRISRLSDASKVHCPACNITYDGTFADSVMVRFRTAPAIRAVDVPVACIGSPARQPHVLAQDRLPPGEVSRFELDLQPGFYRVRTLPPREAASLAVGEDGPSGVEIPLGGDAALSGRLELKRGPTTLGLRNQGKAPLEVLVERRALPPDALTAGQLWEVPGARELLPEDALAPGQRTETVRRVVMVVELPGQGLEALERARDQLAPQGVVGAQIREGQLIATFERVGPALDGARRLARISGCRAALSVGPVLEVDLAGGQRALLGAATDRALMALWGASPGRVGVDVASAAEPEVVEALDQRGLRLDRVGLPVAPGVQIHWIAWAA